MCRTNVKTTYRFQFNQTKLHLQMPLSAGYRGFIFQKRPHKMYVFHQIRSQERFEIQIKSTKVQLRSLESSLRKKSTFLQSISLPSYAIYQLMGVQRVKFQFDFISTFIESYFSIEHLNMNQNNTFDNEIIQQDDCLPPSFCSIQELPLPDNSNLPIHLSLTPFSGKIRSDNSMKYLADRFLPVRKMACSTKELFNDRIQWKEDQENEGDHHNSKSRRETAFQNIYKREILGSYSNLKDNGIQSFSNQNFLRYSYKDQNKSDHSFKFPKGPFEFQQEIFPVKKQKQRKISKIPVRVLDAPTLHDDFYLNLIDWSSSNFVAVGLRNSVYLWNAANSNAQRLVQLGQDNLVTSNAFSPFSNVLATGTHFGEVQLWDCNRQAKISTYKGHSLRVGTIAWNSDNLFASGSRDKNILIRDIRTKDDFVSKMLNHKQQVCGLKWSYDQQQLASGGNDNKVNLWSMHSNTPIFSLLKHTAAVKALAWSPHQHGLLVTGGGTADRTIRFWNSLTGQQTKKVNVDSQVCNLMFAKTVNELVSTHGYSLNEINIWSMPNMQKIQTLTGHTYRVLYLAMNPDGSTIVTGAGDQTLRFWNIFPKKQKEDKQKSTLSTESISLR